MSQLTLIRHGQTAGYSDETDRLTPLGERQALALAEYLLEQGVRFDEVVSGHLRRQVQTEEIVADRFGKAGVTWPEARRDPGWDEYNATAVAESLAPALVERDPAFAKLVADFETKKDGPERNRYFQRMFEELMKIWIAGELRDEGIESFDSFHGRVSEARGRILDGGGSRKVAVFTSGGPIGVCVQLALEAPPTQALHVNWRVRNGTLTEFLFSRDRVSLDSFNRYPHLKDPELQSFR